MCEWKIAKLQMLGFNFAACKRCHVIFMYVARNQMQLRPDIIALGFYYGHIIYIAFLLSVVYGVLNNKRN